MNCNQALTMLSAYRELNSEECDTTELDAHLETCASCRAALANSIQIGEIMRVASVNAPPPDMHAKLMRALADEQMKMLQKSAPGTVSTPEFLKPYIQERASKTESHDKIVAFSTAKTGPLPVISAPRKRRYTRTNQFAILGMAAAVLMLVMMGGLTSLLMLARNNPGTPPLSKISTNLNQPSEVEIRPYATQTLYTNVVSAIPTGNSIYYSAYGNDVNSNSWMLMQFNRNTQISTPLLATPGSAPLVVLSASSDWLVWLEYDRPQPIARGNLVGDDGHHSPQRAWSLHYLSLVPQTPPQTTASVAAATPTVQTGATATPQQPTVPDSMLLAQDIFDSTTAPAWATNPITGTWLNGDTLLVTQIDKQGQSHLESYHLDQNKASKPAVIIATAESGHMLAWPTSNYTGTGLYWANEWMTADGVLHSNIWQQQTFEQPLHMHGYIDQHTIVTQQALFTDGLSFQPQVVDNTLFLLSTSEVTISSQGMVKPNGIPLPLSATNANVEFTPRTDPDVYAAPADAAIHGTIFLLPLDGPDVGTENMLGTVGQATGYQAGDSYVLWRDSVGYQMYDVQHQSNVIVGATLNSAKLLMVNENTALWWSNDGSNAASGQVSLTAFNWPN